MKNIILALFILLLPVYSEAKVAAGKYIINFTNSDQGCGDFLNKRFKHKKLEFKELSWYLDQMEGREYPEGVLVFSFTEGARALEVQLVGRNNVANLEVYRGAYHGSDYTMCQEKAEFRLRGIR